MAGENKVILLGNLGNAPELKKTSSGRSVLNFNLATNERFKNSNDEIQNRTEWHRITVWGTTAETYHKYLNKGDQVYIEGSLRTRKWNDNNNTTHYMTEIHARNIQFLEKKNQSQSNEELPIK